MPDSLKKTHLEEFTLKLYINNLTSSVLLTKVENTTYSEKLLFSLYWGIILFILSANKCKFCLKNLPNSLTKITIIIFIRQFYTLPCIQSFTNFNAKIDY